METRFEGSFTQQEAIPTEAVTRAVAVMNSGRLHRYNVAKGEVSETALLEQEFATYMGSRYCLAVTSGGYALTTVLRALGLKHDEPVLTNAFTLAPVPGAIAGAGGRPIFVDVTRDLVIDIEDLARKAPESGARILMLSHMRGHIADMEAVKRVCDDNGIAIVEDCAHTLGAMWNGVKSGRHGVAGCYSTQTYKHINSGEGGLIVSDDADLMARATILSGSYMLYGLHGASPPRDVFERIRLETPNCSGRMDNLRAAIIRPQLAGLDENCRRWNERYHAVAHEIADVADLRLPIRPNAEQFVASSIQFNVPDWTKPEIQTFLNRAAARGVELKWFGADEPVGFTSNYKSWSYTGEHHLPRTDEVLATLCDMRLPLTFTLEDCRLIGSIIRECAESVAKERRGP